MGRSHGNGPVRGKVKRKALGFPQVFVDSESDFAAIKIAAGVEARSYVKDGVVFCEDAKGKVIEIQVLNLSELTSKKGIRAS